MSKEEILSKHRKHILTITDANAILVAMDEYAKQQALLFKQWCYDLDKIRSGLLIGNPSHELKTDEEKYNQFLLTTKKIMTHESR